MNEVETKIYKALQEIKRLAFNLMDTLDDTNELKISTSSIESQLRKIVGRRIIKESKNG